MSASNPATKAWSGGGFQKAPEQRHLQELLQACVLLQPFANRRRASIAYLVVAKAGIKANKVCGCQHRIALPEQERSRQAALEESEKQGSKKESDEEIAKRLQMEEVHSKDVEQLHQVIEELLGECARCPESFLCARSSRSLRCLYRVSVTMSTHKDL